MQEGGGPGILQEDVAATRMSLVEGRDLGRKHSYASNMHCQIDLAALQFLRTITKPIAYKYPWTGFKRP